MKKKSENGKAMLVTALKTLSKMGQATKKDLVEATAKNHGSKNLKYARRAVRNLLTVLGTVGLVVANDKGIYKLSKHFSINQ